jgi:hypothetical protein
MEGPALHYQLRWGPTIPNSVALTMRLSKGARGSPIKILDCVGFSVKAATSGLAT